MTDLQLFDHYRNSIQGTSSLVHKVELLKKAVELYEGHVFDSGNSEDWVMPTATHYALEYVGVVNELLKIMAEAKDYSDVIKYAALSLEIEPGNMRAHYWRIFALYQSGATEMAKASLPMAQRSLTDEEYEDLIGLAASDAVEIPSRKRLSRVIFAPNHFYTTRFFLNHFHTTGKGFKPLSCHSD